MWQPVKLKTDPDSPVTVLSSQPSLLYVLFFLAGLVGLCALPLSAFHDDWLAYTSLVFLLILTTHYIIVFNQRVTFHPTDPIAIRKGFDNWQIPLDAITSGRTRYHQHVSQSSKLVTHYLFLELSVTVSDDPKLCIRNGTALVFSYGFDFWGPTEQELWDKLNDLLHQMGIQNTTVQHR